MPSQRLLWEAARRAAALHGGECLSDPWTETHSRFRWRCEKGHVWRASLWRVRNANRWCRICENSSRLARKKREQLEDQKIHPAHGDAESLAYDNKDSRFEYREDIHRTSTGTRPACEAGIDPSTPSKNDGPSSHAGTDPLSPSENDEPSSRARTETLSLCEDAEPRVCADAWSEIPIVGSQEKITELKNFSALKSGPESRSSSCSPCPHISKRQRSKWYWALIAIISVGALGALTFGGYLYWYGG